VYQASGGKSGELCWWPGNITLHTFIAKEISATGKWYFLLSYAFLISAYWSRLLAEYSGPLWCLRVCVCVSVWQSAANQHCGSVANPQSTAIAVCQHGASTGATTGCLLCLTAVFLLLDACASCDVCRGTSSVCL